MRFVVLSSLSLIASAVNAFLIVTPASITTCDPLTVQYDTVTGRAPFSLSFHSGSANGTIIAAFTGITGTSYTWDRVTIPVGTNVVIVLGDSSGNGSDTPAITVGQGSSDVCLNNPTSIPVIPSVTSFHPPASTFSGSSLSGSSSPVSSSLSTFTVVSESESIPVLSSLNSWISSVNCLSSMSVTTCSPPQPTSTVSLSTNGGITSVAGAFTIGAISVIVGALLV